MYLPTLDVITKQYIVPNMMTNLNGTTAKKIAKAKIDAVTMLACYDMSVRTHFRNNNKIYKIYIFSSYLARGIYGSQLHDGDVDMLY